MFHEFPQECYFLVNCIGDELGQMREHLESQWRQRETPAVGKVLEALHYLLSLLNPATPQDGGTSYLANVRDFASGIHKLHQPELRAI